MFLCFRLSVVFCITPAVTLQDFFQLFLGYSVPPRGLRRVRK
jgi:hypothetical protein